MTKICLAVLMTIIAIPVSASGVKNVNLAHTVRLNPTVSPKVLAAAEEWFHRFQTGNIDRSQLDSRTNAELTDAMIRREAATLRRFGKPSAMKFVQSSSIGDLSAYAFSFEFQSARVIESIAFDKHGKIAGIDFQTFVAQ